MHRLACLVIAMATLGAACDVGSPSNPSADAGSDGPSDPVGIAIDCSFVFANTQTNMTFEPTSQRTEQSVGGKLIASGMLSDDPHSGRSFSLTLYADDSTVLSHTLYQMSRRTLPHNEFLGDHGFTGLHGVKDPDAQEDVQFACWAREPTEPPHAWTN